MEQTKIEWVSTYNEDGTTSPGNTFNPWIGCTRCSPGCQFCYAEDLMAVRYKRVKWGPKGLRVKTSEDYWKQPHKWNRKAESLGTTSKVFCASLADVFELKLNQPELSEWRSDLFDLIGQTPSLRWLLLTKRPEHVVAMLAQYTDDPDWFYKHNVAIGTSVENQRYARERMPYLFGIRARVRFLSCEPLLEHIDLDFGHRGLVDQVIIGGESGKNARPMKLEWVDSLIGQCRDANVKVFVKQLGSHYAKANGLNHSKAGDMDEWPERLRIREFPDFG